MTVTYSSLALVSLSLSSEPVSSPVPPTRPRGEGRGGESRYRGDGCRGYLEAGVGFEL